MTGLVLTALAVLVLLVLSGFFSGSETALTAASRARMHQLERSGDKSAKIVNRLIETRERLIGAVLIGNNLVNILASALATSLLISLFGDAGVVYATIAMTVLVVIFSEVLPKTYALLHSDRVALTAAPALKLLVAVFTPFTVAVEAVVGTVLRLIGADRADAGDIVTAHEEIRGHIDLHHREGAVVKRDRDMLGAILDLGDLEVSDVMVHRTKMEMLNADEPPEALVDEAISSAFTRLPLWRGKPENIIGVLHVKDLVRALRKAEGRIQDVDIAALARKPWFIPDSTTVQDQLQAFLKRKSHFALVVDEYGDVQGLVTLEDILEEIVGEITDEYDLPVSGVRPQSDGSVIVDGSVPVRDLNRAMDWELPDEEATTIAGLVIHEARQIPEPGQVFTFHGFRFAVRGRQKNRITSLRITPVKARQPRRDVSRAAE
jgi:Mg2+/Co2+ transporter CorB